MNYQIEIANKLLAQNALEAKTYGEQWVHDAPHSFEALQFCGLVHAKLKDMTKALGYFNRALDINPTNVACHNNISNIYLAVHDTEKALQHLHQALRIDPLHPEAYNNFGRLLYKQGRIADAIPHFQKALRINPDYWEAHYNLAHSLASQNQMNAASTHYREVIRLNPEHPIAHFNLGLACISEEQINAAEIHLKKALELMPQNLEAARQLGHVYVTLGKIEDAIQSFEYALSISTDLADVHHNLAILYLRCQEKSRALTHFQETLKRDPTNDTANHMILALSGIQTSISAPPGYIAQLFDQYAEYYDAHVKTKLDYQVPGLLRNAVGRSLTKNNHLKVGRVLDLGCGTGQCGVFFRDLAVDLIGVDLSENMIEKAKCLDAYEKLVIADITDYLAQSDLEPFDLIVAGDVLIYTGDLTELFSRISTILLPKGYFAFTTESMEESSNMNYFLQPTGRYAHTNTYIHQLAEKYGFIIDTVEEIVLRKHEGAPVPGRLYVLRYS